MEGNELKCDFSDSVEWLRPRKHHQPEPNTDQKDQKDKAALKKWCPFTGSTGPAVSSSK